MAVTVAKTSVRKPSPSIDRSSSDRDRTRWCTTIRTLPSAGTPGSWSRTTNVLPGGETGVCATSTIAGPGPRGDVEHRVAGFRQREEEGGGEDRSDAVARAGSH